MAAVRPAASMIGGVPASNFVGTGAQVAPLLGDDGDHVAADEERRHRLQQLAPAVEHADAARTVELVGRPAVEVGAERSDVDGHVRHGLRAVDRDERARGVRGLDDLGDRQDRAEHVAHVRAGDHLHPAAGEGLVQR